MRSNLLLAFKILRRRKFYTCVSLFGISLTLMVLLVVTSLIESFLRPQGPERNSENILVAGVMTITQRDENDRFLYRNTNTLGYRFVGNSVLGMQTPELISVFSGSIAGPLLGREVTGFRNGVKISSLVKRTDANFWRILQFDFIEGRPINEQEHQQGEYVAVISEATRDQYFPGDTAVGKRIELDGQNFQVIGVVKDVSSLQTLAVADIWLPIFATPLTQFRHEDRGEFVVLMQARSNADIPRIQEEYQLAVRNFQPLPTQLYRPGRPLEVYSWAVPKAQMYLQLIGPSDIAPDQQQTGKVILAVLGGAALLFMLLPVFNLVNINISRILERASEIGVRKSFGASSGHLVRQFIVENLVLTVLGGLLGFGLALLALMLIGQTGVLAGESFQFNSRVLVLGFLYILVFGLLSAVYPAWRMSRLDPVQALKGAV
ncbi:MAG: ABC transporter permease [Gammaproteobacteria bacterium]|nr:ABC transporter permease [Gammaproteobacteria bacterium]MDP2141450.1 ABC transporter permease [Gammaproteobacteria bacterium]MDP2347525.1 ABC transporter permease [Gammaproteobacteria bacterium]